MNKKKKQKHTRTARRGFDNFITDTKDFAATIVEENGMKRVKVDSPTWYQHQINKFKVGDKISIYMSTSKPKRTLQQNRYYWGVYLPLVAAETGERNLDRLHKLFAGMFLTEDIVEVLGKPVRIVKSSAALSKHDFSEFIEKIEQETGVAAPPTKNFFE